MWSYLTLTLPQSLQTVIDKISLLQRKAVRLMTFSNFDAQSEPLFKELKILKIKDNIFLQNCLFVHDYFHVIPSITHSLKLKTLTHHLREMHVMVI